ncbi:MAG: response regulator [Chloroflexi bacterium]|nr:response regulator [Chloroflexota bacterium]
MAGEKVFYVEDNPQNRRLVQVVLMAEDFEVITAENGEEGLKMAPEVKPDLVLMDINLPDIDGYEVTTRLRKLEMFQDIPILALTANAMATDAERALKAGCDGHIAKPIDVDTLPHQLRDWLKKGRKKPQS